MIESPAAFIGVNDEGIISFGSGQPDLEPPKEIFENLNIPKLLKYGLIKGEPKLREALAKEYPAANFEEFVVANGASEALDLTLRAIYKLHGPSQILICRPYYYSYPPLVELAGHTPIYTDLINGQIDLDDFTSKLGQAKAVIINSPSNPTGRVEKIETLRQIEKITAEQGTYVISDEVYKDLIYGRDNYLIQGDHVITVNSFSKTYSMCGLRVGYLYTADKELLDTVVDIKTHTSMNTNVVAQQMALQATSVPKDIISQQTKIWEERRDFIYHGLKALGFDLWQPEGAFYVLPKIKNSNQVVSELYEQHNVIVYDGAWFGAPNRIRLSYALEISKIEEGLKRIEEYLKDKKDWLS